MRVCESPDAQTVGGIKLSFEEFTADILDFHKLCTIKQTETCHLFSGAMIILALNIIHL